MTSGGASEHGASLHPEWDLMYRKGLTAARIAELCSVVPQTVGWHLRAQRALFPDMEVEHLANRPAARQPSVSWLTKLSAVAEYHRSHGRFPSASDPDQRVRSLAQWLQAQRDRFRNGSLPLDRRRRLNSLPGWVDNQRALLDRQRWQERLMQLAEFRNGEGRWPAYERVDVDAERVLGVWLHAQRQAFGAGRLTAAQLEQLDAVVPGWNAWRVRHTAKLASGD